jgi:cytochrome c peroxidase
MRRSHLLALVPVALAALAACKKEPPPPTATSAATVAAPVVPAPPPSPPLPLDRLAETREGSNVVLARLGAHKVAIVADEDTSTIRMLDVATKTELGTLAIPGRPGQMLVTREGKLLVALRDDGAVLVAEAHANGALKSLDRLPTSTEPFALALGPDDRSIYVACGWAHVLEGYDLATKAKTLSIEVEREPRAVLVSQDGTHAFVAHGAAGVTESVDLIGKSKKVADLGVAAITFATKPAGIASRRPIFEFDALIPVAATGLDVDDCFDCGSAFFSDLGNPRRFARQGYSLARFQAKDGKGKSLGERILEPHAEVIPGDPREGTIVYYGGSDFDAPPTNQFGFSILDAESGKRTKLVAGPAWTNKLACHLPRATAVDAKQTFAFTACLGSDAVHAYAIEGGAVAANPTYRVDVPTPTGLAIDPETNQVWVFSSFDRTLSSFAPPDAPKAGKAVKAPVRQDIPLAGKTALTEQQLLGRKLFHTAGDPRIAVDGRSCSSCHMEGREDGLVWSTPSGPRQTIQLAGRLARPAPFGWMGKDATIQAHMAQTISNFAGSGLKPEELDALAAYMTVMKGPPQKWRALTSEEARGKDVFASSETGCTGCHAEKTGFSDHDVHNVQSATFTDVTPSFLVPSLTGIGGSAPYFHDGRYASLEELLDKSDGTMGTTKKLSPEDKKALVAYLKTL